MNQVCVMALVATPFFLFAQLSCVIVGRMPEPGFQRARKHRCEASARSGAILEAARTLGTERGIRQVTLTDIATRVGMHKSAMLRYFETARRSFCASRLTTGASGPPR